MTQQIADTTAAAPPPSRPPVTRATGARHLADLVLHLARRELQTQHRFTLLGSLWPLVRQLAQLVILVFLFSNVLDLGIPDYPVFVFAGLVVWTWFSTGVTLATASLADQRHLVFSPGLPNVVLPLVAVAVPLVDLVLALPVLLVLIIVEGRLEPTVLLLPVVLAVQFAFTAGVGLICAALNALFRDVQNLVTVGLMLLFYLTPVFYGLKNVPEEFHWMLRANPLTAFVESTRAVLLDGTLPPLRDVAIAVPSAGILLAVGWVLFHRLEPSFVDEL
jgi:lipopolysaccharide transport system permease protein